MAGDVVSGQPWTDQYPRVSSELCVVPTKLFLDILTATYEIFGCCISSCLFIVSESEVKSLSHVRLFATPWTVAHQAPPSMVFSRQEYWSGLLFPSPGDLPDPGIEPRSPTL